MKSLAGRALLFYGVLAVFASLFQAQGVLLARGKQGGPLLRRGVGQPAGISSDSIKELAVRARLVNQVARVGVTQTFVNTGIVAFEVRFEFPLCYDGTIDRLALMVDGQEFAGQLLPAEESRRIYAGHILRSQDPAELEWMGTGMFQSSVFPVPHGAARKVSLRYNQLLHKDRNLTDFLFPFSTARYTSAPVDNVGIEVSIQCNIDLKSVYSPTHAVEVTRPDAQHAKVAMAAEQAAPALAAGFDDLNRSVVAGGAVLFDLDNDDKVAESRDVRQAGNQTIYKRGDRWDSAILAKRKLEKLDENVRTFNRFSQAYFALVKKNSKVTNAALSQQQFGENLYLEVVGEKLLIE